MRLVDAGWTKDDLRTALFPLLTAPATGRYDQRVSIVSPDNILLVAAGGPGIAMSWLLLPHLSNPISEVVR
jgi:hypothetical protein